MKGLEAAESQGPEKMMFYSGKFVSQFISCFGTSLELFTGKL